MSMRQIRRRRQSLGCDWESEWPSSVTCRHPQTLVISFMRARLNGELVWQLCRKGRLITRIVQ